MRSAALLALAVAAVCAGAIDCSVGTFDEPVCRAVQSDATALGAAYAGDIKGFSGDLGMARCPSAGPAAKTVDVMEETSRYLKRKTMLLCVLAREFHEVRTHVTSLCTTCDERIAQFQRRCLLGLGLSAAEFKEGVGGIDARSIDPDGQCRDPAAAGERYGLDPYPAELSPEDRTAVCASALSKRAGECEDRLGCIKESCGLGGLLSSIKGALSRFAKGVGGVEGFCDVARELDRSAGEVSEYLRNLHALAENLERMAAAKRRFDAECAAAPYERWGGGCPALLSEMAGLERGSRRLAERYREADERFKAEFGRRRDDEVRRVLCDRVEAMRAEVPPEPELRAAVILSSKSFDCGNTLPCLAAYAPGPKLAQCEAASCGGCDLFDSFGICRAERAPSAPALASSLYELRRVG